jgi:hypothetical protein
LVSEAGLVDEVEREDKRGQMLPGIAGVCLFLIFLTMINVYATLQGVYGGGASKTAMLAICTLMAAGIFGLLRLYKWGWALVIAGCLLLAAGDLYVFTKFHSLFFLVRGLFVLVFFLYLSRQETRERLR